MGPRKITRPWTGADAPPVIGGTSGGGPRRRAEPTGQRADSALVERLGQEPHHRRHYVRRRISPAGWRRLALTAGVLLLVCLLVWWVATK